MKKIFSLIMLLFFIVSNTSTLNAAVPSAYSAPAYGGPIDNIPPGPFLNFRVHDAKGGLIVRRVAVE